MTAYAGETIQIAITGTDFDTSSVLSPNEVTAVYVSIFDAVGDLVLEATAATYDEDDAEWIYLWDTTGLDAGGYRAKIEAYGVQTTPQTYSLEFKRIRLNRRPVGD